MSITSHRARRRLARADCSAQTRCRVVEPLAQLVAEVLHGEVGILLAIQQTRPRKLVLRRAAVRHMTHTPSTRFPSMSDAWVASSTTQKYAKRCFGIAVASARADQLRPARPRGPSSGSDRRARRTPAWRPAVVTMPRHSAKPRRPAHLRHEHHAPPARDISRSVGASPTSQVLPASAVSTKPIAASACGTFRVRFPPGSILAVMDYFRAASRGSDRLRRYGAGGEDLAGGRCADDRRCRLLGAHGVHGGGWAGDYASGRMSRHGHDGWPPCRGSPCPTI